MLPEITTEAGRRFGSRPAYFTADGWPLSFTDLDRLSDHVAAGLARRGVQHGSVVVLALPSGAEYLVAYLATAKLGAVTAGINPSLAPPERARLVDLAEPALVIATEELAGGVPAGTHLEVVAEAGRPGDVLRTLQLPGEVPATLPPDPERPVAIVFTSGTTGTPKGAVFSNRQLDAISRMDAGTEWGGGVHAIASTQFAHIGFMTKLPWNLRLATTTHLLRKWRANDILHLVAEHRMPAIGAVAAQVALLLRVPDFDELDLSCVKVIIAGAGPSAPALVREARERFQAAYSIRYSSTESGGLATLTALDAPDEEALYTVGRPRDGIELQIRDEQDRELPAGETGEVCLRSAAVMSGYWHDPEATATTLRAGWLHTGDLGLIDDRGCLRLAGRRKEMFIRGGYNVFPLEVEAVLSAHPDVAEVAVVPRPDPVMGEIGVAVVVPRDPARAPSLEDLRSYAASRIARWKLPEAIRMVDELPLTAGQKLDRRSLMAMEAKQRGQSR